MPDNDRTMSLQSFDITQPFPGLMMIRVNGQDIFLTKPDSIIKVDDNTVTAQYGGYKQTITADGTGNERHNFKSTVTKIEVT